MEGTCNHTKPVMRINGSDYEYFIIARVEDEEEKVSDWIIDFRIVYEGPCGVCAARSHCDEADTRFLAYKTKESEMATEIHVDKDTIQ